MNNRISVVINTLNEESNIRNCLESVSWADEIVVVDMYSNDNTIAIVKEYTKNIYFFENVGYVEPARNFAVSKTSSQWVLIVDADEMITEPLYKEIVRLVDQDTYDLVQIPRRNYFFGRELVATGWSPTQDIQMRLFKPGKVEFLDKIHDFFQIKSDTRILTITDPKLAITHFNYNTVEHYLEKLNRYTTIEAQNIFDGIKNERNRFDWIREFFLRYFRQKGYKDGYIGFVLSFYVAMYYLSIQIKHNLMQKMSTKDTKSSIQKIYQSVADEKLAEFKSSRSNI